MAAHIQLIQSLESVEGHKYYLIQTKLKTRDLPVGRVKLRFQLFLSPHDFVKLQYCFMLERNYQALAPHSPHPPMADTG